MKIVNKSINRTYFFFEKELKEKLGIKGNIVDIDRTESPDYMEELRKPELSGKRNWEIITIEDNCDDLVEGGKKNVPKQTNKE